MDPEIKGWLAALFMACTTIVLCTFIGCKNVTEQRKIMTEAGYIEWTAPGTAGSFWIKPANKEAR